MSKYATRFGIMAAEWFRLLVKSVLYVAMLL